MNGFILYLIITLFFGIPLLQRYVGSEYKYSLFGKIVVHILGFATFSMFYFGLISVTIVELLYNKMFKKEYRKK
jgi:hypothetical protein